MKSSVYLRARLTESQAEKLRLRLAALPFKTDYQEEQHGSVLMVIIACTLSQRKTIREILQELGASEQPEDQ